MGLYQEGLSYIALNDSRTVIDALGVLREGMEAAHNAHPEQVGGKIAILKITPKGVQWIDKGECE
jgi:hypothetical protein